MEQPRSGEAENHKQESQHYFFSFTCPVVLLPEIIFPLWVISTYITGYLKERGSLDDQTSPIFPGALYPSDNHCHLLLLLKISFEIWSILK